MTWKCTFLVKYIRAWPSNLWREHQQARQEVESASVRHADDDVSNSAMSRPTEKLIVKSHCALCSFTSVTLHSGKLSGQKVVKFLHVVKENPKKLLMQWRYTTTLNTFILYVILSRLLFFGPTLPVTPAWSWPGVSFSLGKSSFSWAPQSGQRTIPSPPDCSADWFPLTGDHSRFVPGRPEPLPLGPEPFRSAADLKKQNPLSKLQTDERFCT